MFVYRVYFEVSPQTYHVVSAANVKAAIRRAKISWRAFATSRKNQKLKVSKVERLYENGTVKTLKVA